MGKALHLFTEVLRRSAAGVKAQVVSNTESGALGHRPLGPFNGIGRGGGSGEADGSQRDGPEAPPTRRRAPEEGAQRDGLLQPYEGEGGPHPGVPVMGTTVE